MNEPTGRQDFLKRTAQAVGATALAGSVVPSVHAAGDDTIKIALVGCGGRGTGAAAQALNTKGPVKLWAMADVFEDNLEASLKSLLKGRLVSFEKSVVMPGRERLRSCHTIRRMRSSIHDKTPIADNAVSCTGGISRVT